MDNTLKAKLIVYGITLGLLFACIFVLVTRVAPPEPATGTSAPWDDYDGCVLVYPHSDGVTATTILNPTAEDTGLVFCATGQQQGY